MYQQLFEEKIFGQSGLASAWRVCYQRGLPCQVYLVPLNSFYIKDLIFQVAMGSSSLARELWAILTVYLGTVIGGLSMGLSAVVVPDILR